MKYVRASSTTMELPEGVEGLEGREAVDSQGEAIGHVVDILFDQFHPERAFLELETDGFLGIGQKNLLAPFDREAVKSDPIVIPATKEVLHDAPSHDPSMPLSEEYEVALAGYWNAGYEWTTPPAVRDPFTERPGETHAMRPEQFDDDPIDPHANPRTKPDE